MPLILRLQNNLWYVLLMVVLALLSILFLSYELFYPRVTARGIQLTSRLDLLIAYIFLADFFLGLFFTKSGRGKLRYFRENWLNLISSIPITNEVARALRILRVLRGLRVVRAVLNLRFAQKREQQVARRRSTSKGA